jgi:hypothetical protein
MLWLRRITLVAVLLAALVGLFIAVDTLWNARQWDYVAVRQSGVSDLDARAQVFREKIEIYTRRVDDLQTFSLILLGLSCLYPIIFLISFHIESQATQRRIDRAISDLKDQIGQAMGNLRELREETEQRLRQIQPPVQTPPDTIQYDLACALAKRRLFREAVAELKSALAHNAQPFYKRLAQDIEQGGDLYELANTPPYDSEVNDLLLNVSVGR